MRGLSCSRHDFQLWPMGSSSLKGLNWDPLHWEFGVLATGPPGKSLYLYFYSLICWDIILLGSFSSLFIISFSFLNIFKTVDLISFVLWMGHTFLVLCNPHNFLLLKTGHFDYYNVATLETSLAPPCRAYCCCLWVVVIVVWWLFYFWKVGILDMYDHWNPVQLA